MAAVVCVRVEGGNRKLSWVKECQRDVCFGRNEKQKRKGRWGTTEEV